MKFASQKVHRLKEFSSKEIKFYEILYNRGSSISHAERGELLKYGTEITGIKSIKNDIVFAGLTRLTEDNELIIDHYFLIVKNGDGTFNIVSSYGSDNVTIIQSSILLVNSEFDAFIRALNAIKTFGTKDWNKAVDNHWE